MRLPSLSSKGVEQILVIPPLVAIKLVHIKPDTAYRSSHSRKVGERPPIYLFAMNAIVAQLPVTDLHAHKHLQNVQYRPRPNMIPIVPRSFPAAHSRGSPSDDACLVG